MSADSGKLLQPGHNCWRVEQARRFTVIVDADAYFAAARQAMRAARHSIMLIGWDFDARIEIGNVDEGPARLGDFIIWLARRTPSLEIRVLRWDTGALKTLLRGKTLLTVLRWKMHPRVTLCLDSQHPVGGSHHQKIVVIDDSIAFCGGIDMTAGRWDRPAHLDDDPRRVGPDGKPHPPWHDATSAFDGPAARAMGDLARERWCIATGETLKPVTCQDGCWPENLAATFQDVRLGIARTLPETADSEPVHEVEAMYLDLIARAERMIYAESQYFASRNVARAIASRLLEADGPEIVIVNPVSAEGWLRSAAMDSARARLIEGLRQHDRHDRLRFLHPLTDAGAEIYVHAKIMIVDDCILRVGSSNFNNRSMRLDSECDVVVSADEAGNETIRNGIATIRNGLLAEHLGVQAEEVAGTLRQTGSLIATIDRLRAASGQGKTLADYQMPELAAAEEWLADNEILDPEGPEMIFEPIEKRGLFRGWGGLRDWLSRR
ncbi:phospholipase D-like domain-containing protein [Paracoccus salsus]|uniref:phospholipase D-like domain-containing protein n=1 Tax=Paracoccus salsus TaxID=2911061 RepID=UPI001F382E44|nr:phospholipase D-like domain-containing protein [Paracoccus salsus]MCF3972759.1 phospholipase D-like domain-containing protein [Paracoccus salsus]